MNDDPLFRALEGLERIRKSHAYDLQASADAPAASIDSLLSALNSFTDIVRYLNTRRSTGAVLELSNEAAVQDVLYLMLRPWILDLVPEEPTAKTANRYSIKDFVSRSGRFVVEAKYVRDRDHGKSLAKEINDDIETYRYHASCDHLVFFIYDP